MSARAVRARGLTVAAVLAAVIGAGFGVGVGSASASADGAGWEAFGYFSPTNLQPGSTVGLHVYVYSAGAEPNATPVSVIDHLPAGWKVGAGLGAECKGEGTSTATCEIAPDALSPISPSRPAEVGIPVDVPLGASSSEDHVEVLGGGAPGVVDATIPAIVAPGPAGFGLANVAGWIDNADGTADTQAGSHPYEVTVVFALNNLLKENAEFPVQEARNIDVKLPPGFVGNPNSVPQCTRQRFEEGTEGIYGGCPIETMVGEDTARIALGEGQVTAPIYDIVPPAGVAAQFGVTLEGVDVYFDARVRSGGNNGITVHVENVTQHKILGNSAMFWGVPGEASHDYARAAAGGVGCVPDGKEFLGAVGCGSTTGTAAFLSLPTSCGENLPFTIELLGSWQEENAHATGSFLTRQANGSPAVIGGCERLVHFEPSIAISPDTSTADHPAGLTADLHIPQDVNPEGLATSGLRDTTVVLPEGMSINPGQATGLTACQPSEENLGGEGEEFDGPPSCPASSKVGTDEISTPLLPDKLVGDVYILPSNPPNLELLVAASGDGVNIKVTGKVHLDEATGRLTTTFQNTPDFPVSEFKLAFSGGAQAALVTPPNCGEYTTSSVFEPWAAPSIENTLVNGRFVIASRPEGVSCGTPMGFSPAMTAGATTDQAGGFTGFSVLLQRADDQQRISSLQFKAPEGLSGMISNVPLCGEPQAALGTCSSASQIGHTIVGAGPGPYPLFIPQAGQPPAAIYLTGPYKGSPFGLSIVVPIIAGPFDLGTEIVRARIDVDPSTAAITITTNPLPQIIKGVPADLRSIDAVVDRPGFMFNPTNCEAMSFSGTATSIQGATAPLSSRFQVGSCQALKFKPNFTLSSSGKTSRLHGASLKAKIVYPTGPLGANQATSQANIGKVKIELPKRLPSRLTTLQKACRAVVFEANPANCPAASIVGSAKALTPELPVPLVGPAYFVSHGGEAFPSLIAVLQGDNVRINLVGTTFISKAGVTSSTFKQVPDAPVSTFELTLPEGPYSALAANGNLCTGGALKAPTEFTGQNGAVVKQDTTIAITGCPKKHKASKAKTKAKAKGKGKSKR